jgi:hypothetical protein
VEILFILSNKRINEITGMEGYVKAKGVVTRSGKSGMAVRFNSFRFKRTQMLNL